MLAGFTMYSYALNVKFVNYNKCELHMKGLSHEIFLFAIFYEWFIRMLNLIDPIWYLASHA